jgi:hypothetical protein
VGGSLSKLAFHVRVRPNRCQGYQLCFTIIVLVIIFYLYILSSFLSIVVQFAMFISNITGIDSSVSSKGLLSHNHEKVSCTLSISVLSYFFRI